MKVSRTGATSCEDRILEAIIVAYRASARRYAQAAFELALEADDLDGWLEDLQAIGIGR